jgi:hypothetical protein
MATTTPNFGWDVPTSSDYVKQGAVAIETLGDDIDATLYSVIGSNTKVGMQLLSTTALSGASVTISSIPQTFKSLEIWIYGVTNATSSGEIRIAPNAATNLFKGCGVASVDFDSLRSFSANYIRTTFATLNSNANNFHRIVISDYTSTANYKSVSATFQYLSSASFSAAETYGGGLLTNSAISSLVISNAGGNLSTGTVKVWGIN